MIPTRLTRPAADPFPRHGDPGLQPERTALSWTRTTVALAVVSSVLLRWAWAYGPWIFPLLIILLGLTAGIWFTQRRRYRRGVEGLRGDAVVPAAGAVATLTGALLLLGAGTIILVLAT